MFIPLPDLVVTSASASVACAAQGKRTANVSATVKNQSTNASADLSKVPWQTILAAEVWWTMSGASPQAVSASTGGPKTLQPGQSWKATLVVTNITYPPPTRRGSSPDNQQLGIKITADPVKGVAESNENNNEKLIYVYVNKNDCPS